MTTNPPSTATTSCPHCGTRLRFSSPGDAPVRLRITCGSCQTAFAVQWPGSGAIAQATVSASVSPSVPIAFSAPTTPIAVPPEIQRSGHGEPGAGKGGRGPTFAPGDVLAERYRVLRFLAEGGMGEVFEVQDLELGGRLAAKTVRAEVAADPTALERFRREIQLARRVTHPNVCRMFDVAYHRPDPAVAGTIFLTMELLLGPTLAERIAAGPMTPEEALPIIRQIASALDAAHEAGIVHRDLKPANVVLVPGQATARAGKNAKEDSVRAVVTDFGLARIDTANSSAAEASMTMTAAGFFIGTPAYVAPEQIEGGAVTAATDLYAFGVVMFEMLTAKVPFLGETALATAVKRLQQPAPSPRLHAATIDARWEAAILRCLERRPEDRFARAADLIAALEDERPVPVRSPTPAAPAIPANPMGEPAEPMEDIGPTEILGRSQAAPPAKPAAARKPAVLAALAAVILLSFSFVAYRIVAWRNDRRLQEQLLDATLPAEPVAPRRAIAVLGFRDRSGRPGAEWLSGALAEMLGTELAAERGVRVIAGEEVARMKSDLGLADPESLAPDTLARLRTASGADFLVLGSYTALGAEAGGKIRLDLRLQNTQSAETTSIGETGTEAARLYAEGLERLRRFEPLAARDLLARAVEVDPSNPLAHSALASVWAGLGYAGRAAEEAKKAIDLAHSLPQEQRLVIEGRYAEANEDWPRATEIYSSLFRVFPDDLDYGLRLVAAQTAAGQAQGALATVAALRALPAPAREDPRIDLAEASAAEALADFPRQRQSAAQAAGRAGERGARLLTAQARLSECRALRNLGQVEAGQAACEAGRVLYAQAGDSSGVADALTQLANLRFDRGDLPGARQLYEQALGTFRTLGNKGAEAGALNNLAVVLRRQGDGAEAVGLYEQVLALARETGNRYGEASTLGNLGTLSTGRGDLAKARDLLERSLALRGDLDDPAGVASALDNLGTVLRRQGDLAGARQRQEESLAARRKIGQKGGVAASLVGLGLTLLDQGNLGAAKQQFDESLALCKKLGNRSLEASARYGIAEVLAREGDLAGARIAHEEALRLRSELGEKSQEAASRLGLATVLLAAGDAASLARAETEARAAAEELGRQGAIGDQATALAVAGEAGERLGHAGPARQAAGQARKLIAGNQDAKARLSVVLRTARTLPAAAAQKELEAALAEAEKIGLVELRLEASLALANLDRSPAGAARRAAVASEAKARSYLEIMRRAG
ncbi:MAG TPA: tetratricopeptide repeat protein [Thermoanaerobaculia bacterium]|jgi:serine/threonine protein kinase/tetratricopeptide (TPR) repeat protein|nr:tetratricopeptide repeat protein [Thermoanaerobaculia bacterium]